MLWKRPVSTIAAVISGSHLTNLGANPLRPDSRLLSTVSHNLIISKFNAMSVSLLGILKRFKHIPLSTVDAG